MYARSIKTPFFTLCGRDVKIPFVEINMYFAVVGERALEYRKFLYVWFSLLLVFCEQLGRNGNKIVFTGHSDHSEKFCPDEFSNPV